MLLDLKRKPFILYETLGMASMYYTKRSFIKIAENLIGKFGDVLSQDQLDEMRSNAMLIEQFTYDVCSDMDIDAPDIKFFFKPFDTGRPNETNCVAKICILSFRNLTDTEFDAQIEGTKGRWRKLREEGVEVVDFSGAGISFASTKGKPVPNLFEQLYSTQYPHDAKMDAFRVLDNFDHYMDKLAEIMRPYATRLVEGMPRLLPIYNSVVSMWEQSFANMVPNQMLDLIRVDPANMITPDTAVGFSLFSFNEIGFGYEPGTNDNIATIYIGAGVYPEYTQGRSEKRADKLAEIMKSFTDPVKIDILSRLFHESDYCLNIAQKMELNAGNMSRHLTTLYENGMLLKERRNLRTYYSTDLQSIMRTFSDVQKYIKINQVSSGGSNSGGNNNS